MRVVGNYIECTSRLVEDVRSAVYLEFKLDACDAANSTHITPMETLYDEG
jgi:hypothetical protein